MAITTISMLVDSINFADLGLAVISISSLIISLFVLIRGLRMIRNMITFSEPQQSRSDFAMDRIKAGQYVSREDFEAVFSANPDSKELRRYANKMSDLWSRD